MKKDYIVSRIEASQDGAPYVYVAVSDPNDYKQGGAIAIAFVHKVLQE
jgi:hypothetical protein